MTQINIRLTNRNPRLGRWGIVRLDFDTTWPPDENWPNGITHASRAFRNNKKVTGEIGLPATARFLGGVRIPFDHDLQLWIHGLCGGGSNSYKSDFHSLWQAKTFMSNDKGTDQYADWINLTNLDAGDPALEPMACGGTLLLIVGEGADFYEFAALNAYDDYTQFHPITHPHLFFYPTNSKREIIVNADEKPVGFDESISIPFGQYDGGAKIPIFADENSNTNRIEKFRVRILDPLEEVPNPFQTQAGSYQYENPYKGL